MGSSKESLLREIERLASDVAGRRGVEVVEVVYRPQGRYSLLRIDIERPGPVGVTLEDCEGFSRDLDPLLDGLEGLPESGYDLQVSSPGLERPFRTDDDFRRNLGRRVEIETSEPVAGSRSFTGTLESSPPEVARIRSDDGTVVDIPRGLIGLARQDLGLPPGPRKGGRSPGRRGRRGIV